MSLVTRVILEQEPVSAVISVPMPYASLYVAEGLEPGPYIVSWTGPGTLAELLPRVTWGGREGMVG
mgnify:CR=1 FL=1